MRAGDVRDGRGERVADRDVVLFDRARHVTRVQNRVHARGLGVPRGRECRLLDHRLVHHVELRDVPGEPRFDQHPRRERPRPLGLQVRVVHRRAAVGGELVHACRQAVVPAEFLRQLVEVRKLVAGIRAPRHAAETLLQRVVVHGLAAVRVERARDGVVAEDVPVRAEKPDPVFRDRPSERLVEIPGHQDGRLRRQAAPDDVVVEVAAREVPVGNRAEERVASNVVAAFLRDDVHAHAAGGGFGAHRARLERHFLRHAVVEVRQRAAVGAHRVQFHSVDLRDGLKRVRAVRGDPDLLDARRAADILTARDDARERGADVPHHPSARQVVEESPVDDLLLHRALHVHERRLAGHRDGLFERPHFHLAVDGGDRVGLQRDAIALEGAEALERKRDGIDAGTQIDDLELTLAVAHDAPCPFDQRRAGRLDSHAREHGSAVITDKAGDGALGE